MLHLRGTRKIYAFGTLRFLKYRFLGHLYRNRRSIKYVFILTSVFEPRFHEPTCSKRITISATRLALFRFMCYPKAMTLSSRAAAGFSRFGGLKVRSRRWLIEQQGCWFQKHSSNQRSDLTLTTREPSLRLKQQFFGFHPAIATENGRIEPCKYKPEAQERKRVSPNPLRLFTRLRSGASRL